MSNVKSARLMSPDRYTWEDYTRNEKNNIKVVRWERCPGETASRMWTKHMSVAQANTRARGLQAKGWTIEETRSNPADRFPVISYASAHRWEPMAAARNVSEVARSSRGFMRAYQRAGTWGKLDPWWKARRNAFVARHMAQVWRNHEGLWNKGEPSRRCLALIMWAYMPPGRRG